MYRKIILICLIFTALLWIIPLSGCSSGKISVKDKDDQIIAELNQSEISNDTLYKPYLATVYKGNIIKNLIMDCQSYTKYRPNETTGGIFVSWRRKEELPTGA